MTPVSMKALSISPKESAENKIKLRVPYKIAFTIRDLQPFTILCSNSLGQELRIGFDEHKNAFFIDRTKAGKSDFDTIFAAIHYAPRIAKSKQSDLTVILDNASVELFADGGLTCMTDIFFPERPLSEWRIEAKAGLLSQPQINQLKSIWTSP